MNAITHLRVSNLNNAIRFYNGLFDGRPVKMTPWEVEYKINERVYWIEEGVTIKGEVFTQVATAIELHQIFIRMKSSLKNNLAVTYKLLKNILRLEDPDGNVWLISTKRLSPSELVAFSKTKNCYLEPINF